MGGPLPTGAISTLEECISYAEDRGGYPDFDSSPLKKAVEPFRIATQQASPQPDDDTLARIRKALFRIPGIPRSKVFIPAMFTLLRYYVTGSGSDGLKVFEETTTSHLPLLDFVTESLAAEDSSIREAAALALSSVTRVGRAGSVFSNIVDHIVVTSAQAESWQALEGILLLISGVFQECDTLSDTQFRTMFGIVTNHCSGASVPGDTECRVRDRAYHAVIAAVSHQSVKCKAGTLPVEIRKVAQSGLRDASPSVRDAAASLHISLLGDAETVPGKVVDDLIAELLTSLTTLSAPPTLKHGVCVVLKNLSAGDEYVSQADAKNLTRVVDELCKLLSTQSGGDVGEDHLLVTCIAVEALVNFFDALLRVVFTGVLDGTEDAGLLYTTKVHPQVQALLTAPAGPGRHILFAAGCRCIAELIKRQKAFMKPHLGALFPPVFIQLFDGNKDIARGVQSNWDVIIQAYGDAHSFYSVFTPFLLKGLESMLNTPTVTASGDPATSTGEGEDGGPGGGSGVAKTAAPEQMESAFRAISFLCTHPGAVTHVVNANTASSLFDALVHSTGNAGEDCAPSMVAGALEALNALLSIPNSPLCSSTALQKRIAISLVPTILPLLRSPHDAITIPALDCVESVLRHWVHAFTSPEGLYMLVPETMVLAESPVDRIRYRARPVFLSMIGDLNEALSHEPTVVDVVAGGLTGKIGLDEQQNQSRESRLAVSRALLRIAKVLAPDQSDLPAEQVPWPTFTAQQVHSLLELCTHGILGPINCKDDDVQGNCITFLSVFAMVPQCRTCLTSPENRSLVNALMWYFLRALTMRYDTIDVSILTPFSTQDPDGSIQQDLGFDEKALEKLEIPSVPDDAALQKFLVVAHTAAMLSSAADEHIQKATCENMVAIFGHLLSKNSVVYGHAFLHILPHFLSSGMETPSLQQVVEFANDLDMAMSIPVYDADIPPENLIAKFQAMTKPGVWEKAKISHQLALVESALAALGSDIEVSREQIYAFALSLAHRTSEEGVAGRRVKGQLVELLIRAGSQENPDTSADGSEIILAPPSTPKFFFDIASLLRKSRSSPYDIVEQTGYMLDEYSQSHVTGLAYQAIDAFWTEMSAEQRFMTVAIIQGQLLDATPDEVQQRLQLLGHSLTESYFSSEMRLMLFGVLYSQLASPKDNPQVFLAVCEAVASTLSAMEDEPFNKDLFTTLLETLSSPDVLKVGQGQASAWLSCACTTLARTLQITLDGNSVPTDTTLREFLRTIRSLLQTRGLSSTAKDRICETIGVLSHNVMRENESGPLHNRRRLCLPVVPPATTSK